MLDRGPELAYSNEDVNKLGDLMTPEMLSYFAEELAKNKTRGVINKISDVKLVQGDLAEAWREGDDEYATVAMRYSQIDKLIDRASGQVVQGGDTPDEGVEYWTFRRAGAAPGWCRRSSRPNKLRSQTKMEMAGANRPIFVWWRG